MPLNDTVKETDWLKEAGQAPFCLAQCFSRNAHPQRGRCYCCCLRFAIQRSALRRFSTPARATMSLMRFPVPFRSSDRVARVPQQLFQTPDSNGIAGIPSALALSEIKDTCVAVCRLYFQSNGGKEGGGKGLKDKLLSAGWR